MRIMKTPDITKDCNFSDMPEQKKISLFFKKLKRSNSDADKTFEALSINDRDLRATEAYLEKLTECGISMN